MEKNKTLIKRLQNKSKALNNVQRSLYDLFDEVHKKGLDSDGITTLILDIDEGQKIISSLIFDLTPNKNGR